MVENRNRAKKWEKKWGILWWEKMVAFFMI